MTQFLSELDYGRAAPLPGRWVRLESCVRDEREVWEPPEGDGPEHPGSDDKQPSDRYRGRAASGSSKWLIHLQ